MLQRYSILVSIILRQFLPKGAGARCHLFVFALYFSDILSLFGVALFSSLRTWAICGRFSVPLALVFLCNLFVPCINIYNYSRPQVYIIEDGGYCVAVPASDGPPNLEYYPVITRCIAILADILVLALTWAKSADTLKATLQMKDFRPRLSLILVRNGTMYFLALFSLNLVTLILNVTDLQHTQSATSFIFVNEAIAPTLIARFILDLRSIYYPAENEGPHETTTMNFAPGRFMGNLAAPVGEDSTWNSGSSDDVEADRGNQYQESKEPLLEGLALDDFEPEIQLDNLSSDRYRADNESLPSSYNRPLRRASSLTFA